VKPAQRKIIVQQIRADVEFFQRTNVNDYSVLLGIHELANPEQEAPVLNAKTVNNEDLLQTGI
jgi:hypothetical protein